MHTAPIHTFHVRTFATTEDFFEALLGPSQHDAHVRTRMIATLKMRRREWLDAADARVSAATSEIIEGIRRRRAEMLAVPMVRTANGGHQ